MANLEEVFININKELSTDSDDKSDLASLAPSKTSSELLVSTSSAGVQNINKSRSTVGRDASLAASSPDQSSLASSEYEGKSGIKDASDEYLVRGSSCCTTIAASTAKRWHIYKRDYCGLICQVISPLILIFCGLLLRS